MKKEQTEFIPDGAFIVARKAFDSEMWFHRDEWRVFEYLFGKATHSFRTSAGIPVPRGSYLLSYRKLIEATYYVENNAIKHYSLSRIKRIIDNLVKRGCISTRETKYGTLFTVCNYDKYQNLTNYEGGSRLLANRKEDIEEPMSTDEALRQGTPPEHDLNNNKNGKNEENDNISNVPNEVGDEIAKLLTRCELLQSDYIKEPITTAEVQELREQLPTLIQKFGIEDVKRVFDESIEAYQFRLEDWKGNARKYDFPKYFYKRLWTNVESVDDEPELAT